jgi:hypothetical protein
MEVFSNSAVLASAISSETVAIHLCLAPMSCSSLDATKQPKLQRRYGNRVIVLLVLSFIHLGKVALASVSTQMGTIIQ